MNREELLKQAKPILFNTEMVQAILEGRKTVTRRIVNPKLRADEVGFHIVTNKATGIKRVDTINEWEGTSRTNVSPFHEGDYLYVRETWCNWADDIGNNFFYKATDDGVDGFSPKWKPSIHMPKESARIFLKVTDVRVERLQDITEEQAKAEGSNVGISWTEKLEHSSIERFEKIWNSTIKKADLDKYGWEASPWVWVIEFERVEA